ncbi:MAG: hypothetical protein ACLFPL_01375 [Candidatus Nanoarchaeia archaeon]
MNLKKLNIKKVMYIIFFILTLIIIIPVAIFFLSAFLYHLADNDPYSSKDGSSQVLSPGCPALTEPNGSDFEWNKIKSDQMLENCMFELAYNLETPREMVNWLEEERFDVVYTSSTVPERKLVFATWNPENQNTSRPYTTSYSIFYDLLFTFPYNIYVVYEEGSVSESGVGLRTK